MFDDLQNESPGVSESSYGVRREAYGAVGTGPMNPIRAEEGRRRARVEALEAEIGQLAAHIAAAQAKLATALAEFHSVDGPHRQGATTLRQWLSWRCGMIGGQVSDLIAVAAALRDFPLVGRAFHQGRVSLGQARVILPVASEATEAYLLELAEHATPTQLRRICGAYRSVLDEGSETDAANRRHGKRALDHRHTEDGMVRLSALLTPEDAAVVLGAIDRVKRRIREELGDQAPALEPAQLAADALVELASGVPGATGAEVVVHVDAGTLVDGSEGRCIPALDRSRHRRRGGCPATRSCRFCCTRTARSSTWAAAGGW